MDLDALEPSRFHKAFAGVELPVHYEWARFSTQPFTEKLTPLQELRRAATKLAEDIQICSSLGFTCSVCKAKGGVERVDRAITVGHRVVDLAIDLEFDDGLHLGAGFGLPIDCAEADQLERIGEGAQRLSSENLERGLGALEHIALVLQPLHLLEQFHDRRVALVQAGDQVVELGFFELGGHGGAT